MKVGCRRERRAEALHRARCVATGLAAIGIALVIVAPPGSVIAESTTAGGDDPTTSSSALDASPPSEVLVVGPSTESPATEWHVPEDLEARVDAYLAPYIAMDLFSGGILLAAGDSVLVRKAYGMADRERQIPNTPETRYRIGSITKEMTWLAMIQIKEQGFLDYDRPLSLKLPDWPGSDTFTTTNLVNHRAGLFNLEDLPDYHEREKKQWTIDQVLDMFRDRPLQHEPGAEEHYGSSHYVLAAHLIETISGRPYGRHLREFIFDPAGMPDTGVDDGPGNVPGLARGYMPDIDGSGVMDAPFVNVSIKVGSGNLYSTVDDLFAFRRAVMTNKLFWFFDGRDIYRPKQRNGRKLTAEHKGNSPGYISMVRDYLDDHLTVVVLGNNWARVRDQIVDDLSRIMLGEDVEPPPVRRAMTSMPAAIETAFGEYAFDFDETGRIERRDGHVVIVFPGERVSALIPQEDGSYFLPLLWATLSFERDENGRVTRARWTSIDTGNEAWGRRLSPTRDGD